MLVHVRAEPHARAAEGLCGVARIVLRIKNLIIVDSALARMRTINSWAELLDLFGSAQSSH